MDRHRLELGLLPVLGLILVSAGLWLNFRYSGEGADGGTNYEDRAKMADSFVDSIGVVTHLDNNLANNSFESIYLARLTEAGIRHVREGVADQNYYRQRLKQISDSGIKLNLGAPLTQSTPTRLWPVDQLISLIDTHLELGIRIHTLEGPNEYNNSRLVWNNQPPPSEWPTWLVEFTRDYANSLRNDPRFQNINIVAPTVTTFAGVNQIIAAGMSPNYVDYANVHWYCDEYWELPPNPVLSNLCNLDPYLANFPRPYPGKPIMITETGIPSAENPAAAPVNLRPLLLSDEVAAKYTSRRLLELFNRGLVRTFLYELYIHPDFPNDDLNYYLGLIKESGEPKPAFRTIANLISLTKDPGANFATRTLSYRLAGPSTLRRTLLQKRSGELLLILWNEVDSRNQPPSQLATLTFESQLMDVKTYAPLTSTEAISSAAAVGQLNFQVGDAPLVLELKPVVAAGGLTSPGATPTSPVGSPAPVKKSTSASPSLETAPGSINEAIAESFILPQRGFLAGPISPLQGLGVSLVIVGALILAGFTTYLIRLGRWEVDVAT